MNMPASPGVSARCREIGKVLAMVGDKWTVMIVMVLFAEIGRAHV